MPRPAVRIIQHSQLGLFFCYSTSRHVGLGSSVSAEHLGSLLFLSPWLSSSSASVPVFHTLMRLCTLSTLDPGGGPVLWQPRLLGCCFAKQQRQCTCSPDRPLCWLLCQQKPNDRFTSSVGRPGSMQKTAGAVQRRSCEKLTRCCHRQAEKLLRLAALPLLAAADPLRPHPPPPPATPLLGCRRRRRLQA